MHVEKIRRSIFFTTANRRTLIAYLINMLLTGVILHIIFGAYSINYHMPLSYEGDSQLGFALKGLVTGEWYPGFGIHSDRLAAPFGFTMNDYPVAENLFLWLIKLLSFPTHDYIYAINVYFVFTYFLISFTCMIAMRHFRISFPIAIVLAQIFTFLPYHLLRGIPHLFLASYFLVPLMTLVVIWIWSAKPVFFKRIKTAYQLDLLNYKTIFTLIVLFLGGSGGVYYAFFFIYFALIAGISASISRKSFLHLSSAIIMIIIISGSLFINMLPNVIYKLKAGNNSEVARRSGVESELYALKITQLLLPMDGHRIHRLAVKKEMYNNQTGPNENGTATLGLVGCVGFVFLISYLLFKRSASTGALSRFSILALSGTILATVGGISSLIAFYFFSKIRAYNRISVYLAFFSLSAVAILLQKLKVRINNRVFIPMLLGVLVIGIYDETTNMRLGQPYNEEFRSDRDFIHTIEDALPQGSMVWQLPFMPFPETPPIYKMSDYSHLKGYLHSSTLKWSYGAMKGRPPHYWMELISKLPVDQMVKQLSIAGFAGIYVDRWGYKNPEQDVEEQLRTILRISPIVSRNSRLAFYPLTMYNAELRKRYDQGDLDKQRIVIPFIIRWGGDFSVQESNSESVWRWCGKKGVLSITNASDTKRTVTIKTDLETGHHEKSRLVVKSSIFEDELSVNDQDVLYEKTFSLPGNTEEKITFTSNARRVDAPGDDRHLVFRMLNYSIEEKKD